MSFLLLLQFLSFIIIFLSSDFLSFSILRYCFDPTWYFLVSTKHDSIPTWHISVPTWNFALLSWHISVPTWHILVPTWHFSLPTWHVSVTTWYFSLVSWHFRLLTQKVVTVSGLLHRMFCLFWHILHWLLHSQFYFKL